MRYRVFAYMHPDPVLASLAAGAWLTMDGGDLPFPVLLRVALDDNGALVCTGLAIGFSQGGEPAYPTVSARALRSVHLGALLGELERLRKRGALDHPRPSHPDLPGDYDPWEEFREHITVPRVRRPRQRLPGRAGHPQQHWEDFAEQWQATPGPDRIPVLARRYRVSESTIRRWKERVENDGLLGPDR